MFARLAAWRACSMGAKLRSWEDVGILIVILVLFLLFLVFLETQGIRGISYLVG